MNNINNRNNKIKVTERSEIYRQQFELSIFCRFIVVLAAVVVVVLFTVVCLVV